MRKLLQKGKKLYWWLIGTFAILYLAVAFVSTLHAITFFQLANSLGLAILLGAAYEVGQATVLFSILMSQNRNRFLAWAMMFLLTGLQVTANVYASFKFMDASGSTDWTYWQRAILFGVQAENDEMYKVIISWISGALLPLVALGMTALVADNIKLVQEGEGTIKPKEKEEDLEDDDDEPLFKNPFKRKKKEEEKPEVPITIENDELLEEDSKIEEVKGDNFEEIVEHEVQQRINEKMEALSKAQQELEEGKSPKLETESFVLKEPKTLELQDKPDGLRLEIDDGHVEMKNEVKKLETMDPNLGVEEIDLTQFKSPGITTSESTIEISDIKPVNKMAGWHFMNEFVDNDHNVFHKGKFIENDPTKTPTAKKA